MLKSIVNGAEHDITRIPMKGKNLFSGWTTGVNLNSTTGVEYSYTESAVSDYIVVDIQKDYTFSGVYDSYSSFVAAYNADHVFLGRTQGTPRNSITVDSTSFMAGTPQGTGEIKYLRICVYKVAGQTGDINNVLSLNTMLNEGSTALPYEPYGYQEGWEVRDNQDRLIWGREDELQTATGTLPFKGYALPVKVKSLLGNTVQNGTPAPDNIITPEMCGVRTGNLFDSENTTDIIDNSYINQSGVIISSNSYYISYPIYVAENASYVWRFNSDTEFKHSAPTVGFYDSSDNLIGTASHANSINYFSFNTPNGCKYIRASVYKSYKHEAMLNPGSTALPYEPYGWKVPCENHGENLFDKVFTSGYHLSTNGNPTAYTNDARCATLEPIDVSGVSTVTFSFTNTIRSDTKKYMYSLFDGSTLVTRVSNRESGSTIDVSQGDKLYLCVYSSLASVNAAETITDTMLNSGSEAKPYSPYLNATIPVYLGEVPTVRRVKKLVLDGTESWSISNSRFYLASLTPDYLRGANQIFAICSHYSSSPQVTSAMGVPAGNISFSYAAAQRLYCYDTSITTIEGFKSYLAAQYAAGTPVTVWYVLAEPTTTISNEPLAKIGTYADELTTIQVHGLSAPLYGIGDYKDTLNLSTGVVTRKVKKLVLDGTEVNWINVSTGNTKYFRLPLGTVGNRVPDLMKSTHFENADIRAATTTVGCCMLASTSQGYDFCVIRPENTATTSLSDFKAYLAAQYQAGTPVTVWYVLNTPETETVTVPTGMTGKIEGYLTQVSAPSPTNRSVPKWNGVEESGGTYAVTVYTPPEIPTTTGQNTLTVETEKIHGLTNPLCGIGDYKDVLNLSTGVITRKVKKVVLDGTEEWGSEATNMYHIPCDMPLLGYHDAISDRYSMQNGYANIVNTDGAFGVSRRPALFIHDNRYTTVANFKAYLAAQYTNGTPVTIWYVLETPETETITVPYGLECSVEGYLTQSGTPTPSNPITPDANGILESDGTYAVEVSLDPSNLAVKGHIKPIQ